MVLKEGAIQATFPSPYEFAGPLARCPSRIVGAVSPKAYRLDLPTIGRRRTSPVITQNHCLQARARITIGSIDDNRIAADGRRIRSLPSASPRGGGWRTFWPRCQLPESPCLAPTIQTLLRTSRWTRTGCIPPRMSAEFEQEVLYGRGPAQVGFDAFSPPFCVSPFCRSC